MSWIIIRELKSKAKCRGGKDCPYLKDKIWSKWIPKGEQVLEFHDGFYCIKCAEEVLINLSKDLEIAQKDIKNLEKLKEKKPEGVSLLRNPES